MTATIVGTTFYLKFKKLGSGTWAVAAYSHRPHLGCIPPRPGSFSWVD